MENICIEATNLSNSNSYKKRGTVKKLSGF